MAKRVLRTTKFKLDDYKTEHPEEHAELSELFREYERYKQTLVEEYRKTAEAIADLDISRAMATKSMGKFLRKAGNIIPMVAVEPQWWIYRSKEGDVVMETAFTERDYRNASRAQKAGLNREVQSEDGADLFESDTETEEHEEPVGF